MFTLFECDNGHEWSCEGSTYPCPRCGLPGTMIEQDGQPLNVYEPSDMDICVDCGERMMDCKCVDPDQWGDHDLFCERCGGEGIIITCCDDICVGGGHCIHGDGEMICPDCHGGY